MSFHRYQYLFNLGLFVYLAGFNNQSNYNSQGGGENQGFGSNHLQYHNQVGYGKGDASMNYQYR